MSEPAEPTEMIGQVIKGYEIRDMIGAGGFGQVYRAHQSLVKRDVAIKIILPRYVNDLEFVRRFEAEAQIIANLEHIHIVPLYDFWRDATGAYIVMRWFRGGSLDGLLDNGHLPVGDAARVIEQVSSALAVAHRHNVVHRDIKPANILLDDDLNAYLTDFGIAKDLDHISDFSTMIDASEELAEGFIGSPEFISPEQIRQDPVTVQSDIYNMGLVAYQLLTGEKPFGDIPLTTLITKHLMEPLPHIQDIRPDLPSELMQVINKATEKDASQRYQDIMDFAREFRSAMVHTSPEELSALQQASDAPDGYSLEELGLPPDFYDLPTIDIVTENPYQGLRAFREVDADKFFGREQLITDLLLRLQGKDTAARFTILIGPSGSGKSSVVKAGIVPKLRAGAVENSENWFYVELVPGSRPMEELEAALLRVAINPPASLLKQLNEDTRGLARAVKRILPDSTYGDTELVLVIDQFEEVFTLVENEEERLHFIRSLAEAVQDANCPLRIITTLRADFYDRPLSYAQFGQLVSDYHVSLLPLSSEELERAIVMPAEQVGLMLEPGLASDIIADVGEQPGNLPLLQYALTELFERRDGNQMQKQAFKDIGGVSGALAKRADDIFTELSSDEQAAARQIFMRLVQLSEQSDDTRRRATIAELLSLQDDDLIQRVLDLFGKYRLLTFDTDPITRIPTVELAHEALIRQWQRFRTWLNESRDELRLRQRLATLAQEWQSNKRDVSYLASGSRLQQFEEWIATTELALTTEEREYYDVSIEQRAKLEAAEAARLANEQAMERRSQTMLRVLVAVFAVATIGALGLSFFAFSQQQAALDSAATATIAQGQAIIESDNAATQAAIAEVNAQNSHNLALISGAQLALANGNTDLAIPLALAANQEQASLATQRILAQSAYAAGTRMVITAHTDRVEEAALSPDGTHALSGAHDNLVLYTDLTTGDVLYTLSEHEGWVMDVAMSADGTRGISGSLDSTVRLWDLESGELLHTLTGHEKGVRAVAFNLDATLILGGDEDGVLIMWDAVTGEIVAQSEPTGSIIHDIAVAGTGFTALTGHSNGDINLWNLQSATPLITYTAENGGHATDVFAVIYTPDEMGFVSASEDSRILLWTFETGSPIRNYEGHTERVTSLAYSADGHYVVSGSEDTSIILWDAETAAIVRRFVGHEFLVYSVAITDDSRHILSGSWDSTLRLWDVENGALQTTLQPATTPLHTVDATENLIATAATDGTVTVWDANTFEVIQTINTEPVNVLRFAPSGTQLVTGGDDNILRLWDINSGELVQTFAGHSGGIMAVDFAPDSGMIATGSRDNTIILWDMSSGEQIKRLFAHTFTVTDIDFSPDETKLASSSFDSFVMIWDVESGTDELKLEGHGDWVWSVEYSADGALLLSAGVDNAAILWDAISGQRLRRYEGHNALVYDAHFTNDPSTIVTASADRTLILWDMDSGQLMLQLDGHGDAVREIALHDEQLISVGDDGTLRLWEAQLGLDDLTAWVTRNRYIREFSCAERTLYDVPPPCALPTPIGLPGRV